MSYVSLIDAWQPQWKSLSAGPPALSSLLIDGASEKIDFIGQVFIPSRSAKAIRKVGFLCGAITSAGGSTLRVSLQNVDATVNANPARGDGTVDQSVSFLISAPTANTWYQTGALDTDRSVSPGDLICVRIEYTTYNGADAFNVQNVTVGSTAEGFGGVSHFTSSWANAAALPNIILEFDDGTFGTLHNALPLASITTTTFNTGSNPDEAGLAFTVPVDMKIDGFWLNISPVTAGRDFEVGLYAGTTALATIAVNADYLRGGTNGFTMSFIIPEQTLTAGTQYYLSVKPTTASSISVYGFTVANASHLEALAGGTAWNYSTRVDGGSWAAVTTTQRLFGGLKISGVGDPNASSGGMLRHPGVNGGIFQ